MGTLAGEVAFIQIRAGRHFRAEHPQGSAMFQLAVWKMLAREPQVVRVLVHQCMTGLRGPRSGLPIKKPSEFWASDETLVEPLRGLLCDGSHEHSQLDAREAGAPADKAKDAARWARPLCHRVARGCENCLRKMVSQQHYLETAGDTAQSATLPPSTPTTLFFKITRILINSWQRQRRSPLRTHRSRCISKFFGSGRQNCSGKVSSVQRA